MNELIVSILQIIFSWSIIIYIILKIIKKRKQKQTKEQLKNLELQKYYERKEKYYKNKTNKEKNPYKLNDNIFTPAEKNFYNILKEITKKINLTIMTKVRLADIISTYENNYKYFNKIKAKHIDFVLIDNKGNIKLLIEIDDKSHKEHERQKRDIFLNNTFEKLNIKLLRIHVRYSYNIQELEKEIKESL